LARDFDTSQGVINGWLNSPSHRENMLTAGYKDIGIAVLNGVLDGHETTLVVQLFGTPVTLAAAPPNNSQPPATQGSTSQAAPPPQQSAPTSPTIDEQSIAQLQQTPLLSGAAGVPTAS